MKENGQYSFLVLGPATSFFELPQDDPDSILRTLQGDDRLFVEADLNLARCDFARVRELYDALKESPRYFLASIRMGVIAAIGLGDLQFLDSVLEKQKDFRTFAGTDPIGRVLADIAETWLFQWLWYAEKVPEWITRFDFVDVPPQWRRAAAFLGVTERLNAGNFESAYAAAALLMCNYEEPGRARKPAITAESAYLRMSRAIACRETGRLDEMYKWLNEVIRELAPHGFLLPLLLFMHGSRKSPVEEILAEVAPNDMKRYLEIRRTYFANLIRARNHVLGENATEVLSMREFYLAMLLKRNASYKELADRFGISVGRIKNLLLNIYQKLNIHSRSEIKDLVW